MERLSKTFLARLAGCLLLAATANGCVATNTWLACFHQTEPAQPICKIVATWNNKVVYTPDPTHGGKPTPGLAGRVYLFDSAIKCPVAGDGSLTVTLVDPSKATGDTPQPLEVWHFDKDTLKRLLRQDPIGNGYTLFLPWGTYHPDIRSIVLELRYDPAKGGPIYADATSITLDHGGTNNLAQAPTHQVP